MQKHLARKQKLNDLAKLTKWLNFVVGLYLHGAMTVFCQVTYMFTVNLFAVVAWMSRNSLLKTGEISEI